MPEPWESENVGEMWLDMQQQYESGDYMAASNFWDTLLTGGVGPNNPNNPYQESGSTSFIDYEASEEGLSPYNYMAGQNQWFMPDLIEPNLDAYDDIGSSYDNQLGLHSNRFRFDKSNEQMNFGKSGFASGGRRQPSTALEEFNLNTGESLQETDAAYSNWMSNVGDMFLEGIGASSASGGFNYDFYDADATSWDDAFTDFNEDITDSFDMGVAPYNNSLNFGGDTPSEQFENCVNFLLNPNNLADVSGEGNYYYEPESNNQSGIGAGFFEISQNVLSSDMGSSNFTAAVQECQNLGGA